MRPQGAQQLYGQADNLVFLDPNSVPTQLNTAVSHALQSGLFLAPSQPPKQFVILSSIFPHLFVVSPHFQSCKEQKQ